MRRSEEITEIVKALIQVQSDLKTIKKDRVNPFAESKYATLDAILEEVLPLLAANKMAMTQEPLTIYEENVYKIGSQTTLFHESGQFIEYEPLLFAFEKGSKMNMAQSSGSIITYSKRYSISAILGISTGEDTDGVIPDDVKGNNQHQSNNRSNNSHNQSNNQYKKGNDDQVNNQFNQQVEDEKRIVQDIVKYRNFLANNGKNIQELNQFIANKEGANDIGEVANNRIYGWFKSMALKLENELKQAELNAAQTATQTEIEGVLPRKWGSN